MKLRTRFSRISLLSIALLLAVGTLSVLAGRTFATNQGRGRSFLQKLVDQPVASRVGWITRTLGGKATPSAAYRMATLTVTNGADSGAGSLRQAIADAASGDTIMFSGVSTVSLTSARLIINKDLTIDGGSGVTVTRSGGSFQIFNLTAGTVAFNNLTITNGNAGGGNGGGIVTASGVDLTCTNCTLSGNAASTGGAISSNGTLTLNFCTVSGNTATSGSNGIIANSNTSINNCTFNNNTGSAQTIQQNTIGRTLTITNSTFTGNSSANGALSVSFATATLLNCTFSGNTGSRTCSVDNGGVLNLKNTIVAGSGTQLGAFSGGTITSKGNNLISDNSLPSPLASDLVNTNPLLGSLGNYGGRTQTIRPLPGSPAIDAGDDCVADVAHCGDANFPQLTTDQRGTGFIRKVGGHVDIGAVEVSYALTGTSGSGQSTPVNTAFADPLLVTLTESSVPVSGVPLTFTAQPAGNGASATLGSPNPATTDSNGQASVTATANSIAGSYTVTASATGGNPSASFSLTNGAPPMFTSCPANQTVNAAAGQCTAPVSFNPTASGFPSPSVTCKIGATMITSPYNFPVGTSNVTCTATNGVAPDATCGFTVTVNDTQAPTITCPSNIFAGTAGNSAAVTYPAPSVSDNCAGVSAPACTPASGSSFNVGVTTVTCTVKDTANNPASCSFTVTVNRVSGSALDPLVCTGPGNTVQATLVISNNGNANQTVADTTTFTNLKGVPGSCTVTPNVGTCVVTSGNLTYNATLTPGQTVTITYLTQVSDLALTGQQVCTNNSVAFNGGTPLAFSVCDVVDCPAAGPGGLISAAAEASDQKTGSVLIYNVYTSGATSGNTQNTRINLTNTHSQLPAYVHLFFVAEGCSIADSYICLTANQTASFLASDLDPGTTGYLVAVAVNQIGCPTNFNYLIGDEYVKFTSGHAANLAAEAFAALPGGLPACDGNSVTAQLNFDGVSYNRTPATLSLDNVGSRADGNDTLLILNRIGGNLGTGAATLGTVFGIFYDDAENSLSFSVSGSCQLRSSITNNFPRTTPRFESFIPAGRTGWLKVFNQTGSIGITGAAINFNANAGASAGAFNQGHNLHHLTLNNQMNYVIPIFPPSC